MTDPQTTDPTLVLDDDPYADGYEEPLPPPRPRRRIVTPVTGALAAVVLVAAGFIAGVQVQKGQESSASGAPSGLRAFAAPGAGQGRQGAVPGTQAAGGDAGATPTVGTVANTRGSTLYVVTNAGTTIRVRPQKGSTVTRTTKSHASAVHPGDTVIVRGTTAADGTLKATSVTATAANAGSGLGALFGTGGGTPPGNSAAPSGAPQGFGPPPGG
ncbi:hypothetical protein FSW04_07495 [Baekduia soli]|uniref:DUF5666 domain-containing protein n=1 Tax=Baekduia soli TaxID=496014 RepID=A0A5B8U3I3_9ACTN|nr:hypothetical protein [Baekduia soli]QEC47438.1 hypothetical protein FSW04_07495 [Baekduia soli]